MMFIYRGIATKDYSFATESFCYFIIINSVPVVFASLLINSDKIIQLLEDMNADFLYVIPLESKSYKNTFLNGQLIIWKACFGWMTFSIMVLTLYISTTLILLMYQTLFATQNEHMIRPLIFPMWLPKDDPYRTPNYEIFMVIQSMIAIMFLLAFCVYLYVLFHILLHNYTQMDLIILAFEGVFHGVDESVVILPQSDPKRMEVQSMLNKRMKQIVQWHTGVFDSIDTVSSVFGPPLAYQVLFSSMAICLMAYQVVDQLDKGKFDFLFALLGVGACLQLWIPCYIGTIIQQKAFAVGDACWNCGWHETPAGRLLLRDIVIVILRTQKPLNIKCTCLPKLQLETFSSIMSTAYSYYNMLRQYN